MKSGFYTSFEPLVHIIHHLKAPVKWARLYQHSYFLNSCHFLLKKLSYYMSRVLFSVSLAKFVRKFFLSCSNQIHLSFYAFLGNLFLYQGCNVHRFKSRLGSTKPSLSESVPVLPVDTMFTCVNA